MKAFITGISGFAGSHLAEFLLKEGIEVSGMVHDKKKCLDLKAGTSGHSFYKDVRLFEGDIRDSGMLCKIIKKVRPDEIYHLAAVSNVPYSLENPGLAFEINFHGTRKLFDAVLKSGISAKVLFVGSADSYGDISPQSLPIREDTPFRPASPYALSKAAADLLAYQYFRNHGLHVLRARPFNHIGPGQDPSFVCSNFAAQVARIKAGKAKPVVKVGNLSAKKDFSDVRDVARAYRLILKRGKPGEAFNICRGKAYSIDSILRQLIQLSGMEIEIKREEKRFRKVDTKLVFGDYSALHSRTGWTPKIPLEESLKNILEYHEMVVNK